MKKSIYSSKIISDEEYYREKEQLRNATRDALIEGKPRQLFAQLMAALTVLLSIFFLYPDWIFVAIYAVIFGVTLYLAAFLLGPLLFSFIWIFEWLIIVTLDGNIKWTENLFYSFLGVPFFGFICLWFIFSRKGLFTISQMGDILFFKISFFIIGILFILYPALLLHVAR